MHRLIISMLSVFLFVLYFANTQQAQVKGNETKTENPGSGKHVLGENYSGGKIFWLDGTGQHGLITTTVDQSAKGLAWNPGKAVGTGATADAVFAGQKNSEKIISIQGNNIECAAGLCLDFSFTSNNVVYNDWYLPSKHELNLLFQQKMIIGGFNVTSGIYWSSTESATAPGTQAWEQEFRFGAQYEDDKDLTNQVRCIRKF